MKVIEDMESRNDSIDILQKRDTPVLHAILESITDECAGFTETESMLFYVYDMMRE